MNFFVCASDLAVITGHNTYKSIDEIYLKYWKRYFKEDYEKIQSILKSKKIPQKLQETAEQCIERIGKKNNVDITKMVSECSKQSGTKDFNSTKKQILEKVLKSVDPKEKKSIAEAIEQSTNTRFGIKNENPVIPMYEYLTGNQVEISRKYWREDVFIIPNNINSKNKNTGSDIWSIGGKVDGLTINSDDNKIIVEIKNRVNRLFYKLRDYEKVQIYAYMFALNMKKAHLVECLQTKSKKNPEKNINIIEVDWDSTFWDESILVPLQEFIEDFYEFLESDIKKIALLKN